MNQAHSHESELSKDFSIKQAVSYGWKTLKEHTGLLVGATALVMVASVVLAALSEVIDNASLSALVTIAAYIIQSGLALGLVYIALEVYHGRKATVSGLLTPFDERLWKYIFAGILYGVMVAVGTLLLVIPGIWAGLTFAFFAYPIAEENAGPIEALKYSKQITDGAKLQLLLFFVVVWLLNLVGLLFLGIGLLVTIPTVAMATVSVYYILKEATDETTPPADAEAPLPETETDTDIDEDGADMNDSDTEPEEDTADTA